MVHLIPENGSFNSGKMVHLIRKMVQLFPENGSFNPENGLAGTRKNGFPAPEKWFGLRKNGPEKWSGKWFI